jgi:hypothetical protein
VFADRKYTDCIYKEEGYQQTHSAKAPIAFYGDEEEFLLCVVNLSENKKPGFLRDEVLTRKISKPEPETKAEEAKADPIRISIRALNNSAINRSDETIIEYDNVKYSVVPVIHDDLFWSDFNRTFNLLYNRMYKSGNTPAEDVDTFDHYWNGSDLVNEFVAFRKDFISSDRECAAFVQAAEMFELNKA